MGEGLRAILFDDCRELKVGNHGLDVYTPSNSDWNPCVMVFIAGPLDGGDGHGSGFPRDGTPAVFKESHRDPLFLSPGEDIAGRCHLWTRK